MGKQLGDLISQLIKTARPIEETNKLVQELESTIEDYPNPEDILKIIEEKKKL